VTASHAVGELAAELLLGGAGENALARAFDPGRFAARA
jgi:glycine/D-amino acid oxidase-like deaminating enzyme